MSVTFFANMVGFLDMTAFYLNGTTSIFTHLNSKEFTSYSEQRNF